MADNSDFAASAAIARTEAMVAANRARKCRREMCGETMGLDKRGLCKTHQAIRLATMAKPDAEARTARREDRSVTTIYSLLGNGDRPLVQGADLCHCSSASSARANLAELLRRVMRAEDFLHNAPKSDSGWSVYDRAYDGLAKLIETIKFHEAAVKANWPALVTAPIRIPARLERAIAADWLTV